MNEETPRAESVRKFRVEKYGYRYFAVYEGEELVAVTVYRCGAREVARRLNEQASDRFVREVNNSTMLEKSLRFSRCFV